MQSNSPLPPPSEQVSEAASSRPTGMEDYHADLQGIRRRAWHLARRLVGSAFTENGGLGENPAGAQCVNVPNEWLRMSGCPGIHGDATAFRGASSGPFKWHDILEVPRFYVGDIVVWDSTGSTPRGHVDVCMDGSHEPWWGLDQNYPEGSPVHYQEHDRAGIAGVLRSWD